MPAAKRIVVGYDGSEAAQRALVRAAELAGYGSSVTVVSVAQPLYKQPLPQVADPDEEERIRVLAAEARDRLAPLNVTAVTQERVGDPSDQIVAVATELAADLVVVGTRNGSALERIVLGSTSTRVLHHAPCDVLVVR